MTTNKPEVVAWYFPSSKTTLPVVSLSARSGNGQPLIRLSDYEALQAECEKQRGLLAEIGRGCSSRVMPSEQTIASWAEALAAHRKGGDV